MIVNHTKRKQVDAISSFAISKKEVKRQKWKNRHLNFELGVKSNELTLWVAEMVW